MAICTFNARTLASEACVEDLVMQARKITYDVIGLTETRRYRPLHATPETGEELFLGTCDSGGVPNNLRCLRTMMNENEEELEAFYVGLEKLYREDHTFFEVIVSDFNAKID
ncbi:hypothetical protein V3C99_001638 [Haemonchus contortus]|uniref:Endonuclease/exonuclease/phosphatase family protein n=1 Tax=Haemonchus contortus TaxID=6289 RepID=A0A7I5E959_HAECO